ncbi:MAG TPA: minor capsid protein [Pseudonocardiaceae bacterium]|nr:minor capsid protein [Pseudonocardiaceae bacterium]
MTVSEEVAHLLDGLGLGDYRPDSVGGDIYTGTMPDGDGIPDECAAIALYAGGAGDAGLGFDTPRVQLRFRGAPNVGAPSVEQRAQRAYDAMVGLRSRPLPGGTWLSLCTPVQSGPVYLGKDQRERHEYVINLELMLCRPTAQRD